MASVDERSLSLEVSGFGCIRNGRVLLRNIGFSLCSGEVLLLKGMNGTGKSTLLRSLAGLMPWRAGVLTWCGQPALAASASFQQQLSYLGHSSGMSDALSGLENLKFALQMQGVRWSDARATEVLRKLQILDVVQRPLGRLSHGQQRRVSIARVMLSERCLWLLDEPDNALDTQGCALLVQVLTAHVRAGGMAIVVSHRGMRVPDVPTLSLDLNAASCTHAGLEHLC